MGITPVSRSNPRGNGSALSAPHARHAEPMRPPTPPVLCACVDGTATDMGTYLQSSLAMVANNDMAAVYFSACGPTTGMGLLCIIIISTFFAGISSLTVTSRCVWRACAVGCRWGQMPLLPASATHSSIAKLANFLVGELCNPGRHYHATCFRLVPCRTRTCNYHGPMRARVQHRICNGARRRPAVRRAACGRVARDQIPARDGGARVHHRRAAAVAAPWLQRCPKCRAFNVSCVSLGL